MKTARTRADAGHRTGAGAKRGSPGLRAKPARLLPSSGGCRLAAYPARSEPAAGSGADGRWPGRGTASAAGRTGPPPGRTACGRSRRTAAGPAAGLPADGTSATDLAVQLNGITYQACRGDFVVRLDGSTCLQLWNKEGRVVRLEGDPLEVAQWLQACHDAGMEVRVQVNESVTP
ncbi:Uncharacterised protein [Klebsiella pneumoniae]|nr:Uncharacterised protein [Klebsiella pneumoniae]